MIVVHDGRRSFVFCGIQFREWLIYFWPLHGFRYPLNDNQRRPR